jgi:twitching motility protein PilT
MNVAPGVLAFLAQCDAECEVYLAPGAKPVQRMGDNMRIIDEMVMSPDDVRETLTFLHSHAPGGKSGYGSEGVFSFGMPKRGRFRVSYITQRGSFVVRIVKIPVNIPLLFSLVEESTVAELAMSTFAGLSRGVLMVSGAPLSNVNALIYGLLQSVVEFEQKVVVIVEHDITYLLKHGKSIVVQCEYGPDNQTVESCLRSAMMIAPDIIYVHDLSTKSDMDMIMQIAKSRVLLVVAVSEVDTDRLLPDGRLGGTADMLSGWWNVETLDTGKLRLDLDYCSKGNLK